MMQLFFTVFVAIATFILGIFVDNSLPEPVIDRKADYSNIVLSTEPGLRIEYKISTSGKDEWITYKKPM